MEVYNLGGFTVFQTRTIREHVIRDGAKVSSDAQNDPFLRHAGEEQQLELQEEKFLRGNLFSCQFKWQKIFISL